MLSFRWIYNGLTKRYWDLEKISWFNQNICVEDINQVDESFFSADLANIYYLDCATPQFY